MKTKHSPEGHEGPSHAAAQARWGLFAAVLLFFFLSGACGLLYQVVWTRKLVLLFGTTAYAVSTVLAVFFMGMGAGSLWGGCLAARTNRPLFLYGLFEILIGLWAVAFIFLAGHGSEAVAVLLRPFAASRALGIVLRGLLALAFLIAPVTLMGATLPLLSQFVARERRVLGMRVGALYTLNTFGAVAGCAFAGFYLIEHMGYMRATFLGAAANALVGAAAMALGRTPAPAVAAESPASAPVETPISSGLARLVAAAFVVSGFCTLALEVIWTRLLAILFTGTTYAFTAMLATILCGIAVGAAVASLTVDRIGRGKRAPWLLGIALLGASCCCLFSLGSRGFAGASEIYNQLRLDAGYAWSGVVWAKFSLAFRILFPPTFFLGMTFPFAVKAIAGYRGSIGHDVGRLYFLNTCGGIVGALAGGYVLLPLVGAHRGVIGLAVLLGLMGLALTLAGLSSNHAMRRVVQGVLALGLAMCAAWFGWKAVSGPNVGYVLTKANFPEQNKDIYFSEGTEGTVAVSEEPGTGNYTDRVLWINGVQATASIEKGVKMNRFQGVLPLLFNRDPREVLLMCFGSGITAGTLAASGYDRVDAVEIDPLVYEAAPLFSRDNLDVMTRPNMRFLVDDGRNYLLASRSRYDFITFEPMPLALAGVSTFYTREYYQLCLERLNPGGMVSQWIPLHSLNIEVVRSLTRTFTSVFPEYCAWFVNADLFLIGSAEPLEIDYAAAEKRLARPELRSALAAVGLDDTTELLSCFVMGKEALERFAGEGRIMTDDRPWAEFEAPRLMYERTVQESLKALRAAMESPASGLSTEGMPSLEAGAAKAAVERRFQAKVAGLQGLMAYYGGSFGSEPEEGFIEALRVDPGDRSALYYLRELARQRTELFIRWEKYDEAQQMLDAFILAAPREMTFHLYLGDVQYARGDTASAMNEYAQYLALGGTEARAKERVRALNGAAQ